MQNITTGQNGHDNHPRSDAATGERRPPRTKGIDLPTTVCIKAPGTPYCWTPHDGEPRKGILPDWAMAHLIDIYLPAGHSALLLGARRLENAGASYPRFQTPRHRGYGLYGHGPTGLAVVEGRPRRPKLLTGQTDPATPQDAGSELLEVLKQARLMVVKGGRLAVVLERPTPGPGFTDTTSQAIDAARRAGFRYLQHLAVIDADIAGDQIATPTDAAILAATALIEGGTPVHARIHHDVLVFTNTTRKGAA